MYVLRTSGFQSIKCNRFTMPRTANENDRSLVSVPYFNTGQYHWSSLCVTCPKMFNILFPALAGGSLFTLLPKLAQAPLPKVYNLLSKIPSTLQPWDLLAWGQFNLWLLNVGLFFVVSQCLRCNISANSIFMFSIIPVVSVFVKSLPWPPLNIKACVNTRQGSHRFQIPSDYP